MSENKTFTLDHVKIGFGFFLLDVLLSIGVLFFVRNVRRPDVRGEIAYPANFGWYYIHDGKKVAVTFPCQLPKEVVADGFVELFHEVTSDFSGRSLGFYSKKQTVSISIRNILLYNWQNQGAPRWIKTYGWLFHIVDIPFNAQGMTLSMKVRADIPGSEFDCSEMFLGTRLEIINTVIARNAPQAIVACCLEIIGLFMLGEYILFRKMFTKDRTIFVLSLLSISAGFWQLEESKLLYVFSSNPIIHWVFDYMFFILFPLLLVPFAEEMTDRHDDIVFRVLFWGSLFVAVVECILQFTGVFAFTEMLVPVQVLVLVICLYSLVLVVIGVRKNQRLIKLYLPAVIIMVLGVIVEIVNYNKTNSANALVFGIALVPFFLYLGFNAYRESSKRFLDAEKVSMYHNLAFTDFSTEVFSMTAFYDFIDHCAYNIEYVLYMFDLNNLKVINDTYGHPAGDLIIKTFADCAKKAFATKGTVYRAGGDEFIVVCQNATDGELADCEALFKKLSSEHTELPVMFTASYGSCRFSPKTKEDFIVAQKQADVKMYEMKRMYHKGRGDRRE